MANPIPIRVPIDLGKCELQNARIQNLGSEPGTPVEGQLFWHSGSHQLGVYNGSSWVYLGSGSGTVTSVAVTADSFITVTGSPITGSGTIDLSFKNYDQGMFLGSPFDENGYPDFRVLHADDIPTLTASKISDFDTQVRTSRLDQMASPTGSVSMGNQTITNLGTPSNASDAATKGYTDALIQGFNEKPTATVATAAALPACTYANGTSGVGATLTGNSNGALTVDGYAVVANDLVLVANQASGLQNGLYIVTQAGSGGTPFILTRSVYMDTTAEFARAFIPVEDAGTDNANSIWLCTNSANPTVGSTAINFIRLNKATDLQAGTGISISGNTVSVSATYAGQNTIVTLGTVTTGTWTATAVAVLYGGTGASSASGARTNLGATGKYTALIGNNSATSFAITQATHGLASDGSMIADIYDASTGAKVLCDISINNANGTVTYAFTNAPATNAYRIVIIG